MQKTFYSPGCARCRLGLTPLGIPRLDLVNHPASLDRVEVVRPEGSLVQRFPKRLEDLHVFTQQLAGLKFALG